MDKKPLKMLLEITKNAGERLFGSTTPTAESVISKENLKEIPNKKSTSKIAKNFTKRMEKPSYSFTYKDAVKLFLTASVVVPLAVMGVKKYYDEHTPNYDELTTYVHKTTENERFHQETEQLIKRLRDQRIVELLTKTMNRDMFIVGEREAIDIFGTIPKKAIETSLAMKEDGASVMFARDKKGGIYLIASTPEKTVIYSIDNSGNLHYMADTKKGYKHISSSRHRVSKNCL